MAKVLGVFDTKKKVTQITEKDGKRTDKVTYSLEHTNRDDIEVTIKVPGDININNMANLKIILAAPNEAVASEDEEMDDE